MHLPLADIPTRRFSPSRSGGKVDLRATLRHALRSGGDFIPLHLKNADAAAAAGRSVRYIGIDDTVFAYAASFPACRDE